MVYFSACSGLSVEVIKHGKKSTTSDSSTTNSNKYEYSSEQLLNDLHYQQAKQIIQTLLNKGLISPTEFKDIDSLNKQSFPPLLGPGNVDTSSLQS